jgi:cell division protein FtsX
MARITVLIGIGILTLMFATTMLTVIFATRGAMAGNRHIVEVLHFVGAETSFIASEFQKRFLLIGLKGQPLAAALRLWVSCCSEPGSPTRWQPPSMIR